MQRTFPVLGRTILHHQLPLCNQLVKRALRFGLQLCDNPSQMICTMLRQSSQQCVLILWR